jgi:hypothetical protein
VSDRLLRVGAELLIAVVIIWNAVQALRLDDLLLRAVSLVGVIGITFLSAYRFGFHRATQQWIAVTDDAMGWLPNDLTWHVDDDGVRHALVTQNNGTVRSIAMPDSVQTPSDALRYVMNELEPHDDE